MIDKPVDPTLVEAGAWGAVRYATRSNDDMEARDWLWSADQRIQTKFSLLFRRLATTGRISNTDQFRLLRDGIWEFKRDGHRIRGGFWSLYPRPAPDRLSEDFTLASWSATGCAIP